MKKEWEVKTIGDVCEFQRGLTYTKSDEVDVSDNIVLRATNIDLSTNLLSFDDLKFISDKVVVPRSKIVKKGSLLICTASGSKSHLGKVAFVDGNYGYAFGGFMGMLTPLNGLLPKYLFHLMTSDDYKDFIGALSDGANINNLKFDDLRRFRVPVPPLPEQQRIVALLDEAFAGLATAKANAERNLQNARALFESHLQSVFSQRGEGWVETALESCCEQIFAGGDVPKDRLSKVRTSQYSVPIYSNGEKDDGLYGFTDIARVTKPSVTVSARGTLGFSAIRTEPFLPVVRLIVLVPYAEQISLRFLYYAVVGMDFGNTGTSIPQLTVPNIKESKLHVPPLFEQIAIVEKLDALLEETQNLTRLYERKLAALEELKKTLLHQAFNGEL